MTNMERVDDLIEQTQDPVQRAVLLVLSGIARDLESNTVAFNSVATAFDKHREDFHKHDVQEAKDRSYLKGAWWAGVTFIVFLQAVGGYLVTRYINANEVLSSTLAVAERRLAVMEVLVHQLHKDDKVGSAP